MRVQGIVPTGLSGGSAGQGNGWENKEMRMQRTPLGRLGLMLAALGGGCGIIGSVLNPPTVVSTVDLTQYVGKWYEIARYPTSFEANCGSATAEYTVEPDGTIKVFNTCLATDGTVVSTITGSAKVVDKTTNAKLVVTFPNVPIPAPYWIIDLDPNYQYAAVSDPFRLTLFILSRTPTLDSATLDGILTRLADQGYDQTKLFYDAPVAAP